ncbi:MAG: BPL-N domain-containing protein [Candidatus Symbiodolus clandestinus]
MKLPFTIYLYNDSGVSQQAFYQTERCLKNLLSQHYLIKHINAQEIAQGQWKTDAVLLVIPGGTDRFYLKRLQGQANQSIKQYVAQGGKYLGICAGAYYASASIEFDQGGALAIAGHRPLGFFAGTAVGPLFGPHSYNGNCSARCARLRLRAFDPSAIFEVFYNGGPHFIEAEKYPDVTVIAEYEEITESPAAAIITIKIGEGVAVLSAVHIEYDALTFPATDRDLLKLTPTLLNSQPQRLQLLRNLFTTCELELHSAGIQLQSIDASTGIANST